MHVQLNSKPIAIKLTKAELLEFYSYLQTMNPPKLAYDQRSKLYYFFIDYHFKELTGKVITRLASLITYPVSKKTTLKVNIAEQRSLSILFKYYDCSEYMLQLQTRFIHQLTI